MKEGRWMKITQLIFGQSFRDKFDSPDEIFSPVVPGEALTGGKNDPNKDEPIYFWKGVGKLFHLAKWSRLKYNMMCAYGPGK